MYKVLRQFFAWKMRWISSRSLNLPVETGTDFEKAIRTLDRWYLQLRKWNKIYLAQRKQGQLCLAKKMNFSIKKYFEIRFIFNLRDKIVKKSNMVVGYVK